MASDVLVQVTRGGMIECVHRGSIAVVNSDGLLLYGKGEPAMYSFLRSSAKPVQAVPVVESGAADHFKLTEKEVAIFCASHSGEEQHTETVYSILEKIGLQEEALSCGTHMPMYMPTAKEMIIAGKKSTEVHCNCSGKHSGMLTYAQHMGYPVQGYTEPDHPVQKAALKEISYFAEMKEEKVATGVDGCGVVVFGIPLYNMALSFARLADPDKLPAAKAEAVKRITAAMMKYPEMVGGTGRLCTDLMANTHGKLFAKSGAEGVYTVGIPDRKIGIAVKIDDGSSRGIGCVIIEVLKQLGVLDQSELEALKNHHWIIQKNHRGDSVGEIKPVFELSTMGGIKG